LDRGSFSIAREWTDWADPSPYGSLDLPPRRLDADSLFELAALLERLTHPEQKHILNKKVEIGIFLR